MARTLINVSPNAKRGQPIEIRATIAHPMETGYRPGDDGKTLPRNILQTFTCHYNGELIFSAEMFAAVSANPYLAFHTIATDSGQLVLKWEGDNGFSQTETVSISVTS